MAYESPIYPNAHAAAVYYDLEELQRRLAASEDQRIRLEELKRASDLELRRSQDEINRQRVLLDQAAANVQTPSPPAPDASMVELRQYNKLKVDHQQKLDELQSLRAEFNRMQSMTNARAQNAETEISALRRRLAEKEVSIRSEALEKRQRILDIAKGDGGIPRTAASRDKRRQPWSRTKHDSQRAKRLASRRKREALLREKLQGNYSAYLADLQKVLRKIMDEFRSRQPDNPMAPAERMINSIANVHGMISERDLDIALADYGAPLTKRDMKMLGMHFDIEGNGELNAYDFVDGLEGDVGVAHFTTGSKNQEDSAVLQVRPLMPSFTPGKAKPHGIASMRISRFK